MKNEYVSYNLYHKARENWIKCHGRLYKMDEYENFRAAMGLDMTMCELWVYTDKGGGWNLPYNTVQRIRALAGPHFKTMWKVMQINDNL